MVNKYKTEKMKGSLLFAFVCLVVYQTFCSDSGQAFAENTVSDTLSWTWEVSSTVSTRTKTCTLEFSSNLLVNWGDGVTEWIPDSLSSKTISHVYSAQANYTCTAIGVGIGYFKADSRRILGLDVGKAPLLTYLSCTGNQLKSLDLSKNILLVSLYCASNELTTLDVRSCLKLQTLTCSENRIAELKLDGLPDLRKVTCHTNPLSRIEICPSGTLGYLSCSGCSLTAGRLDSIFTALPRLSAVSSTKNLYVLNNPGSSFCHSEIAAAKNWTLDRVITYSSLYVPSVSCRLSDSVKVEICLKNTAPCIALEMDVALPDGFELDTLRSGLSPTRKGGHQFSVARMLGTSSVYKVMAYSMKVKDVFSGTDGAVLELYLKSPAAINAYTLDIKEVLLLDTLTNTMEVSVTDGRINVTSKSLVGDANGDQKVDVTDVVNLVAWINGRKRVSMDSTAMDVDGNGKWNVADIAKMVVLINSLEPTLKSVDSGEVALSLYLAGEAQSGNHLFVRQSEASPANLELCLDNQEEVQAFQADLILPDGLSLQTGQFSTATDRSSVHCLSISGLSGNRYRILSYAMSTDAVYKGKTGVLAILPLLGTEDVPGGEYPVRLKLPVLTGMDLRTVGSASYDVLMTLGKPRADSNVFLGTDGASNLWVQGLQEFSVWDLAGKLVCRRRVDEAEYCTVPLQKGMYLVSGISRTQEVTVHKVAVR